MEKICMELHTKPFYGDVKKLLGDASVQSEEELRACFERLMGQMRGKVRAVSYVRRITADQAWEPAGISIGSELLAVVLTLPVDGADAVDAAFAAGEPLDALVADALQNAWLFAADRKLQEQLRLWCSERRLGIAARLEPFAELSGEAARLILEQFSDEPDFDVCLTAGGMLSPEKSMCYLLELSQDCSRFEASHDCSVCKNERCGMKKRPIWIVVEDYGKKLLCPPGTTLLSLLQEHHMFISAPCSGRGNCGKCRIRLVSGSLKITPEDERLLSARELEGGIRLACSARPTENLRIRILSREKQHMTIRAISEEPVSFSSLHQNRSEADRGYQIALDLGTTTLAACLYGSDASGNRKRETLTAVNCGRTFGADVMSRMDASIHGKKLQLQKLLQEDICQLFDRLCKKANVPADQIEGITIAANQPMVHLLLGASCQPLTHAPFETLHAGWIHRDAEQLLGTDTYSCPADLLPAVSAFVGGDIVSGMLFLGMDTRRETTLFLDMGTNGEMALRHKDGIFVTSAAAGPAFEGGGISCGCASIPGAVCSVGIQKGDQLPRVQTIDDAAVQGICGSGVLELVSELRAHDIIDENGTYRLEDYRDYGYAFAKRADGTFLSFTQADVRAFQLAKAAIRAGIEILLQEAGIGAEEVTQVYLAGGFGVSMNEQAAIATGLLPNQIQRRIQSVGNTSLAGAILAGETGDIALRCSRLITESKAIVLSECPSFEPTYLKYINL